jgi:N-acetylglucosamine-6-sulfatase
MLEPRAMLAAAALPSIENIVRDRSTPGFHFAIHGSASPHSTVQVNQVGHGAVGQAEAAADGTWSLHHGNAQLVGSEFRYQAHAFGAGAPLTSSQEALFRPNFVIVNVDDMNADELSYMANTLSLLAGSGTTFTNSFVPTSLSGPSRASLLSGQYAHNHGVFDQLAPLGGEANDDDSNRLPVWLKDAGYETGWFGKVSTADGNLRPTDSSLRVPPGWSEYHALVPFRDGEPYGWFYGVATNHNGVRVQHHPGEYSTDILAREASQFVSREGDKPFFVYFAPYSGHSPFTPAHRHATALSDVTFDRPPNYNRVGADFTGRKPLDPALLAQYDEPRRNHLRSLLSVDEAIVSIYNAIAERGEIDNTVFVFTADNALFWGEHALIEGKNFAYEVALRVPLVIRDGRVPASRVSAEMALNIDIAPTFARMAGVVPPAKVDGRDLTAVLHGSGQTLRDAFLLENRWGTSYPYQAFGFGSSMQGVRTAEWKYLEYESGRRQLYNLVADPHELTNVVGDPRNAEVVAQLARRLRELAPKDEAGPVVEDLKVYWRRDGQGTPLVQIEGIADDRATGNSPIKTPEFYLNALAKQPNSGRPLESPNGEPYRLSVEAFQGQVPLTTFMGLPAGRHEIVVHARDAAGNWGPTASKPVIVSGTLRLDISSDSGTSWDDGRTVRNNPLFRGVAGPNERVDVYAHGASGLKLLGSTRSDAAGAWSFTSPRIEAGVYRIVAVHYTPAGTIRGISPTIDYHLLASLDDGVLTVRGTNLDDHIRVDNRTPGRATIYYADELVGWLPTPQRGVIEGLAGNDTLIVQGPVDFHLIGGLGNDTLIGGSGNDILDGGAGSNVMRGGPGDDRYVFSRLPQGLNLKPQMVIDRIFEAPGEGIDTLDFSKSYAAVDFNQQGAIFARMDDPAQAIIRRVELDGGRPEAFERVVGTVFGDRIQHLHPLQIHAGVGNNVITISQQPANLGVALPQFELRPTYTKQSRLVIAANDGILKLHPGMPASIAASGDGTRRIELLGPTEDLHAFLGSADSIRFHLDTAERRYIEIRFGLFAAHSTSPVQENLMRFFTQSNSAPELSTSTPAPLLAIQEDNRNSYGTPVWMLRQGVSDRDANAPLGIAVTSAHLAHGTWQFTLNNGVSWQDLGRPTSAAARLIPSSGNDTRIRFVPDADFFGNVGIGYFAWDGTQGAAGGTFDVSLADQRGGMTAFSANWRLSELAVTKRANKVAVTIPKTLGYRVGDPPVAIAPNATVRTPEGPNLDGGWLRVAIADGAQGVDRLSVTGLFRLASNQLVFNNSVVIGHVVHNAGVGGTPFRVNFNAQATRHRVELLLRSLHFNTVNSGGGSRTVNVLLSDGKHVSDSATLTIWLQGK